MVAIFVKRFDGMEPSVSPRLLGESSATAVVNANLLDGSLRGIHVPFLIREMDKGAIVYQSSFKIKHVKPDGSVVDIWQDFPHPYTDFVKGPLVNDAFGRYYWASPGLPLYYNSIERMILKQPPLLLGVPAPAAQLAMSIALAADQTTQNITRSYLHTYVTQMNEEGPPSAPVTLVGKPNDLWKGIFPEAPNTPFPGRDMKFRRVYRTVFASDGSTKYWLVGEYDMAAVSFQDERLDVAVAGAGGVILGSTIWNPPKPMDGIILMPDGFLVGYRGRDIYFSEKYRPHAWPEAYTLSVEHPVVGLGVMGQTCVVMTEGHPVGLSGSNPANISMTKTNTAEPCLSRGSIVSSPEGVYYASHNGLVLVNQSGIQNITQALISKREWQTRYKPKEIRAARYKTQYIGINDAGRGFILNFAAQRVALSEFNSLMAGQNLMNDLWTGEVHLIGRNNVYLWDPELSAPVAALWRSKEYHLPRPVNMGVVQVDYTSRDSPVFPVLLGSFEQAPPLLTGQDFGPPIVVPRVYPPPNSVPAGADLASSFPIPLPDMTEEVRLDEDKDIRLRIWADRQIVFDSQVRSMEIVRLPSGFKSDLWQFEVISRLPVMQIVLADTSKELRNV